MARTTGPFLSQAAAGGLSTAIHATRTRGGFAVRQSRRPAVVWTNKQRAARAWTQFLTRAWTGDIVAAGTDVDWTTTARAHNLSNYHAYLQFNQRAAINNLNPTFSPLITPSGLIPAVNVLLPTPQHQALKVSLDVVDATNLWGCWIGLSEISPLNGSWDQSAAIIDGFFLNNGDQPATLIRHLATGSTWFVLAGGLTQDGTQQPSFDVKGPVTIL